MAASVANLVKYYADTPPPKKDPLAEREARLAALRKPGYRSPFKFDPSLGVGPFGTAGYGRIGAYSSIAEALKPPNVHSITSLYPLAKGLGPGTRGAPNLSELLAQDRGPTPSPLWKQLAEMHRPSPGLIGSGKFLYDGGNFGFQALEALRPQFEKFGLFMQPGALEFQNLQRTFENLRLRPPFLYGALDAWEAFLEGDLDALDRFIVEHLDRRPDDRLRLAVQRRLERAFGIEDAPIPEWAGDPDGFYVGVFRLIRKQVRAEEAAMIDEVERLREAGVDRVKVGFESGGRLRKVLAQDLRLDHKQLWIDEKLRDHYILERFPGAVLATRAEEPHLPEMPSRKREPNLRSRTVRSVEQEGHEGLIKERVVGRPLETTNHGDLAVPFDPKQDRTKPPSVVTVLSEDSHIEIFEAQERERGRLHQLHDAIHRAGLSSPEEEVMRLKWLEGLGNKEIAARVGRPARQVGVEAYRGLKKVTAAARG